MISSASFNYLYEISAIPEKTRAEYLAKLKKRKNSSGQKNIKLLEIIYDHVNENKINKWNPVSICNELKISMRSLYIHKSRLFKGLKEFYFKWKEAEMEITYRLGRNNNNRILYDFERAKKMFDIGMMKESKILFTNILRELKKNTIAEKLKYNISMECYEKIISYYLRRRNKKKMSLYLKELKKVYGAKSFQTVEFSRQDINLNLIRLNLAHFYKVYLDWYKKPVDKRAKILINYLQTIYNEAQKIDNYKYMLEASCLMTIVELISGNYLKAGEYCLPGFTLAKKLKYEKETLTFASIFSIIRAKLKNRLPELNYNWINSYYRLKEREPLNFWTRYLENSLVMNYYPEKNEAIKKIFIQLINSNILLSDYSFAVYWRFALKSETYSNELLSFFDLKKVENRSYLEMGKVSEVLLYNLAENCTNTLCFHKALTDIGFIWDVYKSRLQALFFEEKDFDYDEALLTISKMEWLKKKKKKITGLSAFGLLKLAFKMLEFTDSKSYMMNRYVFQLKMKIDDFKNTLDFNITDYAVLSSLARRLKSREITEMVQDFYDWIELNHPEIIKPVLKEIEKKCMRPAFAAETAA